MADLVETFPKQGGKSPQRRRRDEWEADKRAGYRAIEGRSGGVCEVRGCDRRAAHHHHKAGRVGPGVNDPDMLMHVCPRCDLRITTEPLWAKGEGYSLDRVPRTSKVVES